MRFLPDVRGQFKALKELPDGWGFDIGDTPNPSSCKHYQSMTRVDAADGTPYFLVTRSGNLPHPVPFPGFACNDSHGETDNGHLVVVRMGSRPKHGERLRSNRLRKGARVSNTLPSPEDRAVTYFTVIGGDPADPDHSGRPGLVPEDAVGGSGARVYQHPGGMALVGHMLAIALEHPRQLGAVPQTQIMFFDVSNPERPVFKSQYAPIDGASEVLAAAGVVAVTPLPGGRYLMITAGGEHNSSIYTYRSTLDDLSSPQLSWEYMGAIPGLSTEDAHQTFAFLRQGNIDGPLYLAGARGHAVFSDRDRIDLYPVSCPVPDCDGGGVSIDQTNALRGKRITPFPSGELPFNELANLAAASTFYVSPSGELIFYATEHDNEGPNDTVNAGEWRHIEVVRQDSPTLLPSAAVDGPYEVDEGGNVSLTGTAGPPVTRAFLQIFSGLEFGASSLIADIDDIDLDDYTNLSDVTRSWNWYAPIGCTAFAVDHDAPAAKTLDGTGGIGRDPDLRQVVSDAGTANMDLKVDEIGFDRIGCEQYYTQPFVLRWDLDVDGSFESTGGSVTFDARAFDGPSEVVVPAIAQDASNGPAGTASTTVIVRNVAPQFSQFSVTDGAGNQVNVQVPFVLTNLPVTTAAQFSDPGVLDHQTATLSWGDASVDANPAFTTFDEAFSDGTGALSHTHRYTAAGSDALTLTVQDDDGGVDTESLTLQVVTPEQAVSEIIGLIDAAIAGASDDDVRKSLEKARKALAGSNDHSQNGALQKIRAGQPAAATAFLKQAVLWLSRAQENGADATMLIALLEQVIAALSA